MSIRVLFFASLADIVGTREVCLSAAQFRDVRSVYSQFEKSNPRLAGYSGSLKFAVNSEFASPDTPVADGDEVAFLPPVSGG